MAVTGTTRLSQIQRATSWNPYFWVTVLNILSCQYFTSVKSLVWMTHKSLCLLHLTNSPRTDLVLLVNRILNIGFYLVTDYYYLWRSISVTKILTTFLTYYAAIYNSGLPTIDCWSLSTAVFLLMNCAAAQKFVCIFFYALSSYMFSFYVPLLKKKKIQPKEKSSSMTKYTIRSRDYYFNFINMHHLYSTQTPQLFSRPVLSIFPFPLACFGWYYLQALVKSTCKIKRSCRTSGRSEETK